VHKDSKEELHKERVALNEVDTEIHRTSCVSERESLIEPEVEDIVPTIQESENEGGC